MGKVCGKFFLYESRKILRNLILRIMLKTAILPQLRIRRKFCAKLQKRQIKFAPKFQSSKGAKTQQIHANISILLCQIFSICCAPN